MRRLTVFIIVLGAIGLLPACVAPPTPVDCGAPLGPGVNLSGCDLSERDFRGVDLTAANLSRTDMSGVDMTGATVVSTKLAGANLTGALLRDVNLDIPQAPPEQCVWGVIWDPRWCYYTDADLTGARLAGATIDNTVLTKADLSRADLSGATLTDVDLVSTSLVGADLSGATIRNLNSGIYCDISIYGAGCAFGMDFTGASLRGADVAGVAFDQADFTGADLTGLIGGASFPQANFSNAKLQNIVTPGFSCTLCTIAGADIDGSNIGGFWFVTSGGVTGTPSSMPGYRLIQGYIVGGNSNVPYLDFSGEDLSGLSFGPRAGLSGIFVDANLDGVNFFETSLSGDFTGASMRNAYLDLHSDALGATFTNADLTGVQLSADASGSNFTNAQLGGAYLTGSMRNTTLTGANLGSATLSGADFTGAIGSPSTTTNIDYQFAVCPDGRSVPPGVCW